VIKIRRVRRLVAAGAGAEPTFDAPPGLRDRPDPPRDELVARVVDVIEVPYLKPIARRRLRDRVDCPIVWPPKLDAPIRDVPVQPVEMTDEEPRASLNAPRHSRTPARTKPLPSTLVGGAVAACGYVLGSVATGGRAVFAASLVVALALLVTVVAASIAFRAGNRGAASARRTVVIVGGLVLTALVTAGAGAWRPT
jgi:hypothetical protein